MFQTDPCGVEATNTSARGGTRTFQTDPCGVEATDRRNTARTSLRFYTDPCGVEARAIEVWCRQIVVGLYVVALAFAGALVAEHFGHFWGAALGYHFVFWILMDAAIGDRPGMFAE